MKLHLQIRMNEALYLRDPERSELGKKIIGHSVQLIHKTGFESFNFKKLAEEIGSTEAGIYRYFENKHKLLIYLTAWYWGWLEFQIGYHTNNIVDPGEKLRRVIRLLSSTVEDDQDTQHINERLLHQIVITEGSKTYLTRHVGDDNNHKLFKPYKDVCALIGQMILEYNPEYSYPRSMASTIIEMAHLQNFFMHNLPSLTDFGNSKKESDIIAYLEHLVFGAVKKNKEE